jgi:hypothetical protein
MLQITCEVRTHAYLMNIDNFKDTPQYVSQCGS